MGEERTRSEAELKPRSRSPGVAHEVPERPPRSGGIGVCDDAGSGDSIVAAKEEKGLISYAAGDPKSSLRPKAEVEFFCGDAHA